MNHRVLDRVHAPGRAARTPYYPTHRVRAGKRTQCAWLHAVRHRETGCTACSSNVQSFAHSGLRAEAELRWPRDRTRNPARPVQGDAYDCAP